ncbi:NAC domain-containing protein 91-like isoform X3 [Camellia sinensis]|uniref:NAC domain-containing protein 91-like isoform X3 n=1 Tax=Camellia sinensis TaxID=4442 RepID=UPI00103682E5|nr:NAC domain-containing protein 91-like isoform X3 [Camellia sinensis]
MEILPLNALPIGYRFSPTDEELINHFLRSKINGDEEAVRHIRVVDLCNLEPWDLPGMSLIETNDNKWIFFCPKNFEHRSRKRMNRATRAGYWKVTGRNRLIKSVDGTSEIGEKKTLVFYTGRSGKGPKKTNWVIHEYCASSDVLDGTNPGQGSYVLFKLIKKKLDIMQSESTEGSNRTTLDTSLPIEIRVADNVGDKSIVQDKITEGSNGTTLDSPLPIENCVADNAGDKSIFQPDLDPDLLRHLVDPSLEPLDFLDKIQSPSHSLNLLHVGPDPNGVLTEHLASVVAKDSGSYKNLAVESEPLNYINLNGWVSYFDTEVPRAQFDSQGSSSNSNVVSNVDTFGTGIKLRARQPRDQTSSKNFGSQGNARRRNRLQKKLQDPSLYQSNFTDLSYNEENHEAKAEGAEEEHSVTADPDAIIDETQDTSLSKSSDVTKVAQELAWNMKSRSDFPRSGDEEVPSASLKAPPALFFFFSSMHMLGVLFGRVVHCFCGFMEMR